VGSQSEKEAVAFGFSGVGGLKQLYYTASDWLIKLWL